MAKKLENKIITQPGNTASVTWVLNLATVPQPFHTLKYWKRILASGQPGSGFEPVAAARKVGTDGTNIG